LAAMAAQARVVLTTVGPYVRYGEPVVRACVEQGTDYVDITGEPAFVDMTRDRYHDLAREAGVRLVSCCGFDSIPHDLGVLFTVEHLPAGVPLDVEGFVQARGSFSGGTWTSAVDAFGQMREQVLGPRGAGESHETDHGRSVHGIRPRVRYERAVKGWVAPFPTIDPQVVLRSARVLDRYGPEFRYGHYVRVGTLPKLAAGALAIGGMVALSQLEPTRELLLKVRQSGEGPGEAQRSRSWFRVTFIGRGGGRRVVTRVSGGDPGYDETAKMVSEAALCLAHDGVRLPQRSGALTPATAMGSVLRERLQRAGIRFDVLEDGTLE
ncbi:MAG: saccharopine dehydrogenase family protein, partial [Myxococcota bacterium]